MITPFFNVIIGQDFAFQQFTVKDGLPSAYLYDIVQDKEGYLWIATEGGLCKYDGHQFIKTPIKDLNQKEIIELFYDSYGQLWFSDISNSLSYYKEGILYNIDTMPYPRSQYITQVYEDYQGDHIFINDWSKDIVYVENNDLLNKNAYQIEKNIEKLRGKKNLFNIGDSLNIIVCWVGIATYKNGAFTYIENKKDHAELLKEVNKTDGYPTEEEVIIFTKHNDLMLYNIKTHNLRFAFTKERKLFESGILSLFKEEKEGRIWVSTRDGLVLVQLQEDGSYKFTKHLQGKFVGIVLKDQEGNYWITTQKDGLYFLPSIEVKTYNSKQFRQITAIATDNDGNIYLGSDENNVDVLNRNFELKFTERLSNKYAEIYDIISTKEETFFLTADASYTWDKAFRQKLWERGSFKTGKLGEEGNLWIGTSRHMSLAEDKIIRPLGKERTYSVFPTAPNEALFGTVHGLYNYKNKQLSKVDTANLNYDIRDIYVKEDGSYILATQGEGLILYKNGTIRNHYTTKDGLSSNTCKKVLVDGNDVWIGTNKGINKLELNTGKLLTLNDDNGIPDNEINYLSQINDTIIVATNNGVAYFQKDITLESETPNTIITNLKISEKDTTLLASYELGHKENNIKIEYVGLCYKHAKDIMYQYKMGGLDEDWIMSDINVASYSALPSGNYTFYLRSRTPNSNWSPEKNIKFSINRPFWKTVWFGFLCLLLFVLLISGISRAAINRNKKEAEIQQKLKASQLTALRAQMNPHFMYNALNSIQEFIIIQDKRSANRYLSQFSRLMRTILSMSDQDRILLKQELEALELYLSLELLRFEDEFEYKIEMDEMVDPDHVYIPSMIVQPYVENAIKHGLHHQKGQKLLFIRFKKRNQHLVCEIEDNGVGRERSKEIKANNERLYPSKAMSLTAERLKLLDTAYEEQLNVEIIDLKDDNNNATGTKVILLIKLAKPKA